MKEIFELLAQKSLERVRKGIPISNEFLHSFTREHLDEAIFSDKETLDAIERWPQEIASFRFIEDLLKDPLITEIIIHSNTSLQIETSGTLEERAFRVDQTLLDLAIETLPFKEGEDWNTHSPFCSFFTTLQGQQVRVGLLHRVLSPSKRSKIFIRKIAKTPFPLCAFGINPELGKELKRFILQKKNILISGATGSGKTAFLQGLLEFIPAKEHVIVLEDTKELQIKEGWTQLVECGFSRNGKLKDFCHYALRMRPDRIVLGEMRSKEVVPFTLSMNTGHRGLLSSIHADSARDSLYRVSLLLQFFSEHQLPPEVSMDMMCKNIDIVIFLKKRKVEEIHFVHGSERGIPFTDPFFSAQVESVS
jgi:Flp pilus assembly CpaF family ATPase